MRGLAVIAVALFLWALLVFAAIGVYAVAAHAAAAPPSSYWRQMTPAARAFREQTWRTHPCLAAIVDLEDGLWDPTLDYGGGHGNTAQSYGLPQSNPGTKMASAGPDWRTSRRTQLRWMRSYSIERFGSECAALAHRRTHGSY